MTGAPSKMHRPSVTQDVQSLESQSNEDWGVLQLCISVHRAQPHIASSSALLSSMLSLRFALLEQFRFGRIVTLVP